MGLELILPQNEQKYSADFYTAAVCKKGAYTLDESFAAVAFEEYRNRVIVLHKTAVRDMYIIGVHIPLNGNSGFSATNYWDSLIELRRIMPKDKPVICMGDLNTCEPGHYSKSRLYEFMSKGFVDFWTEKGYGHNAEAFPEAATYVQVDKKTGKKTNERLDYVLVTGKDFAKLNIRYDIYTDSSVLFIDPVTHKERQDGLSDHSAIMLGTPSELEPFKTKT